MKKVSTKQAKRLREYAKVRVDYLKRKPMCEVRLCHRVATDIHHKKGRLGELLTNDFYFMSVCRECHTKIEKEGSWAKENGYSLNRNTIN